MVKLNEEVAQALMKCHAELLSVEVPGSDQRLVLVEQSTFDTAMVAVKLQQNVELIREGIADLEAGKVLPLDKAMEQIRRELRFQPRQAT